MRNRIVNFIYLWCKEFLKTTEKRCLGEPSFDLRNPSRSAKALYERYLEETKMAEIYTPEHKMFLDTVEREQKICEDSWIGTSLSSVGEIGIFWSQVDRKPFRSCVCKLRSVKLVNGKLHFEPENGGQYDYFKPVLECSGEHLKFMQALINISGQQGV